MSCSWESLCLVEDGNGNRSLRLAISPLIMSLLILLAPLVDFWPPGAVLRPDDDPVDEEDLSWVRPLPPPPPPLPDGRPVLTGCWSGPPPSKLLKSKNGLPSQILPLAVYGCSLEDQQSSTLLRWAAASPPATPSNIASVLGTVGSTIPPSVPSKTFLCSRQIVIMTRNRTIHKKCGLAFA